MAARNLSSGSPTGREDVIAAEALSLVAPAVVSITGFFRKVSPRCRTLVLSPACRSHPVSPSRSLLTNPTLLHEFFRRAARCSPGHVAIEVPPSLGRSARRAITYAELDRASDALAASLREVVTQECVVAILLPRTSEHIYLAQLGVMKAGAAYVCIDPTFPDAQVGHILDDAAPVAVLTDAAGLVRVRTVRPDVGPVRDVVGWAARAVHSAVPPTPAWLSPQSLAYLIYTSGTTGRPKGVMIEHAGIANLIRGDQTTFPVSPNDRVGQNSSCAYDSSVEEIWMALASGATLVVMDDETTRLGPDLVPWLRAEGVTIFCPPPTLLRSTGCEDPERELPSLHRPPCRRRAAPARQSPTGGAGAGSSSTTMGQQKRR